MICFIDEKRQSQCEAIFDKEKKVKITLISLTEDMRNELHCWRTLYKEQENMNQPSFQALLKNRQGFPETRYASYTCINHCKIDFVCRVIDQNLSAKEFLCWIDFGYFMKTINIPKKLLDVDKMDIDKFNCWLVERIDPSLDNDYRYLLSNAPERIQGNSWFARRDIMKIYEKLYHDVLEWYQNMGIADDDQAIMLMAYFRNPGLFSMNKMNFGWHKMMVACQKDDHHLLIENHDIVPIDFAYVTFVNENVTYINLMKTTINSVLKFSKYKIIVYCINFDGNYTFPFDDRLVIRNISNVRLSSIYYFKPYVIMDSIRRGLQHGFYIESDDVLTPFCDRVYDIAQNLQELPISPIHPVSHLLPLNDMIFLNVISKTQGYIHAHVVFKYTNLKFILEWFHECLKKNNFINADETVLNCMYWNYGCINHFLGNELFPNDPYYLQFYERPEIRDMNHIFTFHGCKDPDEQKKLLDDMIMYYEKKS